LYELCLYHERKVEKELPLILNSLDSDSSLLNFEDNISSNVLENSISYLEQSAKKIKPIVIDVLK